MSKFTSFILFNTLMYVIYLLIDTLFTFFDWYSTPQLGHDIMVMPSSGDIWLIAINTVFSFVGSFYLLSKIKKKI